MPCSLVYELYLGVIYRSEFPHVVLHLAVLPAVVEQHIVTARGTGGSVHAILQHLNWVRSEDGDCGK
jgi:hypothetical protein